MHTKDEDWINKEIIQTLIHRLGDLGDFWEVLFFVCKKNRKRKIKGVVKDWKKGGVMLK